MIEIYDQFLISNEFLKYQCRVNPPILIIIFQMSEDHHQSIENEQDEESAFYKSQERSSSQEKGENIPSKSDKHKKKLGKRKGIHKKEKGQRKQKTSKQEQIERRKKEEAERKADEIINQMEKAYDEDRKRYEKKKPANLKLVYLKTLTEELKNIDYWDKFLELGGLSQIQLWFSKLPEGIEPSLTLRKGLLELLDTLKIKVQHISKVSSIQRIVQKHKKSQIKQLRDLSESILLKWSKTLHEQEIEG